MTAKSSNCCLKGRTRYSDFNTDNTHTSVEVKFYHQLYWFSNIWPFVVVPLLSHAQLLKPKICSRAPDSLLSSLHFQSLSEIYVHYSWCTNHPTSSIPCWLPLPADKQANIGWMSPFHELRSNNLLSAPCIFCHCLPDTFSKSPTSQVKNRKLLIFPNPGDIRDWSQSREDLWREETANQSRAHESSDRAPGRTVQCHTESDMT